MTHPEILNKAKSWLKAPYDPSTQKEVQQLIESDPEGLTDAFYKDLDFGTGGLRGTMGVGSNRVNRYTLGMATQGLANYLKRSFSEPIRVVISHDSRHHSREFAVQTAEILSANGMDAYLFPDLRPTPLLSFAIRHLGCQSGIMITASHNPPEYNGYKVYWSDGGQLVPPHDKAVIDEVRQVAADAVLFNADPGRIHELGTEVEEAYLEKLKSVSLGNSGKKDLKIVFTSIHGTAITLMPQALKALGFENVQSVQQQSVPDGSFPTVKSPNPEEAEALDMAVQQAEKTGADLVIGCDPDADRVGIAVRDHKDKLTLLNGNQTAAVLIYYLLESWKTQGKLNGQQFIAETIVTSDLLQEMAKAYGVDCQICLTGFKWIADLIRKEEGKKTFIGGGEESYGYLVGDFVRDKDAIGSAALIAEAAAWAKAKGSSFFGELEAIHLRFGLYEESLKSITRKGKDGAAAIKAMMDRLRSTPPTSLAGSKVIRIKDFEKGAEYDLVSGSRATIDLPRSNVLQIFTEDGYKITARPSGTEPKIKFYISLRSEVGNTEELRERRVELKKLNEQLIAEISS